MKKTHKKAVQIAAGSALALLISVHTGPHAYALSSEEEQAASGNLEAGDNINVAAPAGTSEKAGQTETPVAEEKPAAEAASEPAAVSGDSEESESAESSEESESAESSDSADSEEKTGTDETVESPADAVFPEISAKSFGLENAHYDFVLENYT